MDVVEPVLTPNGFEVIFEVDGPAAGALVAPPKGLDDDNDEVVPGPVTPKLNFSG